MKVKEESLIFNNVMKVVEKFYEKKKVRENGS
jgi:hypothetical protein